MSVNADFAFANAQTKLKSLLTRILDPRRKIQMIVYLDEAHTLTERISYGLEGNTLYDCLVSAFSDYASVPVFFLSLSTDSRMGALAPSALQVGLPVVVRPVRCSSRHLRRCLLT